VGGGGLEWVWVDRIIVGFYIAIFVWILSINLFI
jgi:hypothetical protein